ncbi:ACP S-malonyltransferase [Endozoicomonas montiporae]|uniref:Malonyl CoA-acyl carrier protein transacylase n=1 Tax=Endozoicomonas montiporae CL-33 TaxID=570277 RepID=A0A142BE40_9GAMM|nr:ACP S-malonyltransferase [Endozoicomonas montiporae]AMO57016.1 ACP S-malonyltransferase [Endozoicomonas montiporae CL-33]
MMDKLAFIFPGQGSQSVGMLAEHIDTPVVQQTFAEASEVLGFDLLTLVTEGPAEALNRTENTQPALLTASVALWRLWQEESCNAMPAFMAGHSLGEYSALVCAGAMTFADAVRIVRQRGLFMQDAVPQGVGAMAAVLGLDDDKVLEACAEAAQGDVVEAVNFNSPGQVVIAGHAAAVERAIELAKTAGARRAMLLPVSVPSHCALMKPAAERLAVELQSVELKAPAVPVIHNVTADVSTEPEQIRSHLVAQLHSPVRWVETINRFVGSGVTGFAECGPGKVLAGLNKRIARRAPVATLESVAAFEELLAQNNDE